MRAFIRIVNQKLCVAFALLLSMTLCVCAQEASSQSASVSSSASAENSPEAHIPKTAKVVIHTGYGDIVMKIEVERAPITARNFLRYVDQKRLDGMTFYRAVKIGETGEYGMLQGGIRGDPKKVLKPIPHEPTTVTGLSHINGAVSMARLAPGSATAEFFIVLGDLISLDAQPANSGDNAGYAVFGQVIEGMDVVKTLLELPRSESDKDGAMKGQMLKVPVKVISVRRIQ
ncbi:MAG TPA: peptidylprolyl isomerase [Steroidobacteraceae bacterium]|nr:peptidylprolyl isomerase [Steroidobacteraceae bacterium]